MAQNNANQKLNDLLISKDFSPQALDSMGKPAPSPDQADLFSFDFVGTTGQDYGTVVIMIDDNNDLNVYFGDNVGKSMEGEDKQSWFDFLYQIRQFAKRNLMTFSLQNLNKLKYSMQGQAALKEGLFEGWAGNKTNSWNGAETEARLMIKHKKQIKEGDARFRYIESLFIETADGERFKLPFTKLSAGRAMLEHVRQGGKPYDIRGNHIATIVEEMNLLSRFKRANHGKIFEGETQQLVEQATHYYESLQSNLKTLSTKHGYKKYFESWNPTTLSDEDVIIEDLRHMFVEKNIDSRIEQALPLLAKLQQEQSMKEANIFENWANLIVEGTWAVPDTKEKQAQLVSLLSQELPVGPDATNATEQLYDLLGDDELFDKLQDLADQDANADARQIILARLEALKDNQDIAQVIGQLASSEPVQEEINSYDIDNTPCPACHEKELTYLQGTNHCKCGCCGKSFNLAGKSIDEIKDPRTQTEDPPNTPQPKVTPNQLDELNPDTLKSYVKKASSDRAMRNFDQGVDAGTSMNDREPKFDWHNSRKDDQRRKGIHKALGRLEESGMSEADILLQDIARGNVDIYDIYANPKSNIEKFISKQIHEKYDELVADQGYHPDDDVEEILQRIQRELEVEYGVDDNMEIDMDEGAIGRTLGGLAGVALAGGPEDPLALYTGPAGAELGDRLGDKVSDYFSKKFSKDKETDESVGGGNFLESSKEELVHQLQQVQNQIEKIVRTGGRVGLNDPLSQKMKMIKDKLHSKKVKETDSAGALSNEDINESTGLAGQYGHSGRLEEFKGNDPDTIARIQALAGVRTPEAQVTEESTVSNQEVNSSEESGLLRMKSLAGIFIR